jgi:hypothetical protein
MLSCSTVKEIRRLLAEGKLSQRKIAVVTGVSRGSVNAIAIGRRADYPTRELNEEKPRKPSGPPKRCPKCGAMVYMPCVACSLREQRALHTSNSLDDGQAIDLLPPNLNAEHQEDYENIHTRVK